MSTNEAIRQRVQHLIQMGISQAYLARQMGLSASWISRWLHQDPRARVIGADAIDALVRYERALLAVLDRSREQRPPMDPGALTELQEYAAATVVAVGLEQEGKVVAAIEHAVDSLRPAKRRRSDRRTAVVPRAVKKTSRG